MQVLLSLWAAGTVPAVNYQPYPIGERSAGMGGAFLALSDDGAGCYYNPAGLAFSPGNRLSLSGTVYDYTEGRFEDMVRLGGAGGDLSIETFSSYPSSFASVYRFADPGRKDAPEKPNVFAFSVTSPTHFYYRGRTEIEGGRLKTNVQAESTSYWAGPSYARRLGSHVGLGTTLFAAYQADYFTSYWSGRLTPDDLDILDEDLSLTAYYEEDRQTVGLLLLLGARFSWRGLSGGVAFRTPSLQVWGKGVITEETFVGYQGVHELGEEESTAFVPIELEPLLVGLGVAYESPIDLTFAADLKLHGPAAFDDADRDAIADRVELDPAVNANIGLEYVVRKRVPLRAGFYTDASPVPADADLLGTHIDVYGLTLGAGIDHEQYTFGGAFDYAWGVGSATAVRLGDRGGELDTRNVLVDARVASYRFMLATSYRF